MRDRLDALSMTLNPQMCIGTVPPNLKPGGIIREKTATEVDDIEAWKADAIMRCEAGEDIWQRPKPVSGNFSSQAAGLANLGRQQSSQQMQSALAGQSSVSSQMGALTGLAVANGLLSGKKP